MKRPLRPEELRVWRAVAATVHPLPGRETPTIPAPRGEGQTAKRSGWGTEVQAATSETRPALPHPDPGVRPGRPSPRGEGNRSIEPNRKHRIVREREEIGARLDLHGMDQDRARAALDAFLRRAWNEGYRAVLVITGKGLQGDGVLKRRAPEWLAAPHLAPIVAGIAEAHRRHGGEGAIYVALKRKPKL